MLVPVGAATFSEALRDRRRDLPRAQGAAHGARPLHERRRRRRLRARSRVGVRRLRGDPRGGRARRTSREGRDRARSRRRASSTATAPTCLERQGGTLDGNGMIDLWADLVDRFPIVSIEDGLAENDWAAWQTLTDRLGGRVQLVGDDLFVTNVEFLRRGIAEKVGERDPRQGQPDRLAHRDARRDRARATAAATRRSSRTAPARPRTQPSPTSPSRRTAARSRPGAPARSDRTAKYNQLLRIEDQLGDQAVYPGWDAFPRRGAAV